MGKKIWLDAPTREGTLSQKKVNYIQFHLASFPGHVGSVNSWPGNEASRLHPVYYYKSQIRQ